MNLDEKLTLQSWDPQNGGLDSCCGEKAALSLLLGSGGGLPLRPGFYIQVRSFALLCLGWGAE